MDENEFEIGGKTYVSRHKAKSISRCQYCAFSANTECASKEYKIPECSENSRKDGRSVIFVEKHQ